jgi:hypothetical protein
MGREKVTESAWSVGTERGAQWRLVFSSAHLVLEKLTIKLWYFAHRYAETVVWGKSIHFDMPYFVVHFNLDDVLICISFNDVVSSTRR